MQPKYSIYVWQGALKIALQRAGGGPVLSTARVKREYYDVNLFA